MGADATGLVGEATGLWRGMGHAGPWVGRGRAERCVGCMGTSRKKRPPTGLILGIDRRRRRLYVLGLWPLLQR